MTDTPVIVNLSDNLFCNESTGAIARVTSVDTGYAYMEVLWPEPSTNSVPIAEYDSVWASYWRPATAGDVAQLGGDSSGFRPPANATEFWPGYAETS